MSRSASGNGRMSSKGLKDIVRVHCHSQLWLFVFERVYFLQNALDKRFAPIVHYNYFFNTFSDTDMVIYAIKGYQCWTSLHQALTLCRAQSQKDSKYSETTFICSAVRVVIQGSH